MASTIETLLSLNPTEALVRMLNDANGTNYRLDRFVASDPIAISGTTTKVTLTPFQAANKFDTSNPQGTFTVTYERLEMASFLKSLLDSYRPSLPMSTQNILSEITRLIGQKFYIDDIILEEVTRDNGVLYRLKAKEVSLRFVGYVELPLINLKNISHVIPSNLLDTVTPPSPLVFPINEAFPFANGTSALTMLESIGEGEEAQYAQDIVNFMNAVLTDPRDPGNYHLLPWYVNETTPGPFNLMNAEVVFNGYLTRWKSDWEWINHWLPFTPLFDDFDSLIALRIDGAWTSNFQTSTLCVPYTRDASKYPHRHGFNNRPRLTAKGVVSLSNATDVNVKMNEMAVGDRNFYDLLSSSPTLDAALDNGYLGWNANSALSPVTLDGATVVYNGQVRKIDVPAATSGLDRVMVVNFDNSSEDFYNASKNSMFEGYYPFYYKSPIEWNVETLEGIEGSAFFYDFTPENNVEDTYTYVIDGPLPDGVSLVGSVLSGTIAQGTENSYPFDLTITNTTKNISVLFHVTLNVSKEIKDLEIVGDLPEGVVGLDYSQFLDIVGGLGPYTNTSVIPDAIPLTEVVHHSLHVTCSWPKAKTYYFTVSVASADGQTASRTFALKVASSYAKLQVNGSFNNAVVNQAYSSYLPIVGGSGVYNKPTVINGIMPQGLDMVIGTTGVPKVVLEGTPTEEGIFEWTSVLTDSENNSVEFTVTVSIAKYELSPIILADHPVGYWKCAETSGLVLHDASGNGHDGVIVSNSNVVVGAPSIYPGLGASLQTTETVNQAAYVDLTGVMPKGAQWTIECICKNEGPGANFWNTVLCTDAGSGSEQGDPGIYALSAKRWHARTTYGDAETLSGTLISENNPAHLSLERNGDTANFYVNGKLVDTKVQSSFSDISDTLYLLGSGAYPSSYGIQASICEVAIYDYALGETKAKVHAQKAGLYVENAS